MGREYVLGGTFACFIWGADENIDVQSYALAGRMKPFPDARAAKLVVVIDDDPLVLDATSGLLQSWGCRVIAAESYVEAITRLAEIGGRPDLIVCDYRLSHGTTGVDAIESLRNAFEIPALLISSDLNSPSGEAVPEGYCLLQKPVNPETFRVAVVNACLPQHALGSATDVRARQNI